jgi:hypothetical protein
MVKSPIVTYNRQGVAKPGVTKRYHAIAYTSSDEPREEIAERPSKEEGDPMLPGIRIVPTMRRNKFDKMSRVDFSRMYTVEHNVKVYNFGNVHAAHLGRLQSQWIKVITNGSTPAGPPVGPPALSLPPLTYNSEEEDEEDEEEKEEEGEERDTHHGSYYYTRANPVGKRSQLDPPEATARPIQPDDHNLATPGTGSSDQPGALIPSTELLQSGEETRIETFVNSERCVKMNLLTYSKH